MPLVSLVTEFQCLLQLIGESKSKQVEIVVGFDVTYRKSQGGKSSRKLPLATRRGSIFLSLLRIVQSQCLFVLPQADDMQRTAAGHGTIATYPPPTLAPTSNYFVARNTGKPIFKVY